MLSKVLESRKSGICWCKNWSKQGKKVILQVFTEVPSSKLEISKAGIFFLFNLDIQSSFIILHFLVSIKKRVRVEGEVMYWTYKIRYYWAWWKLFVVVEGP